MSALGIRSPKPELVALSSGTYASGQVQGDYYAILGVSPASEDVVIRAAYRALMRRYHPDADPSSDATERARLINAAYAVLSNPEQRRKYDGTLAARGLIKLDQQPKPAPGVRVTPVGVAVLTLTTAVAAAFALSPPVESWPDVSDLFGKPAHPAAIERVAAKPVAEDNAETGCSTDAAKGLIKAELFDRASRLRGSDPSILTPVADRSLVRIDLAEARGGGATGSISCGGWLAIDLPSDVAVDGGRRNLNAEIIYSLVPAGSKGLRLTDLSGVNGLAQSLATLGRAAESEPPAEVLDEPVIADAAPVVTPPPVASAVRRVGIAAATGPEQVVRRPSTSIPEKVVASRNLAALDKHLDLFMTQSVERSDAAKRKALKASEQRFRKRRDACRTEACQTDAYVREMQAISEIMAARQP